MRSRRLTHELGRSLIYGLWLIKSDSAQASFSTDVQVGRYDAANGWILKNERNCQFSALPISKTGFMVDGDVRSLIRMKTSNGFLYLAGRNQDSLKIFERKTFNKNVN
jgi:hypothetical protein